MINKIIRNFIAKQMAGRSDDGIMITLREPQRVTLGENILADTLMRYGIDPTAIKSEAQLKNILEQNYISIQFYLIISFFVDCSVAATKCSDRNSD